MSLSIAIAGKGGTGKTTTAALLVRTLVEAGVKPVLAVDADPNSNLAEALGVEIGECADMFQPDNMVQHFHEFTPAWDVGVPPTANLIVDYEAGTFSEVDEAGRTVWSKRIVDVLKDMWSRET